MCMDEEGQFKPVVGLDLKRIFLLLVNLDHVSTLGYEVNFLNFIERNGLKLMISVWREKVKHRPFNVKQVSLVFR